MTTIDVKVGDNLKEKKTYSGYWTVIEIKERGLVLGVPLYGSMDRVAHRHLKEWGALEGYYNMSNRGDACQA